MVLTNSLGINTSLAGGDIVIAGALRGHFQTTFADLNVIMTLGGGGSGAVT